MLFRTKCSAEADNRFWSSPYGNATTYLVFGLIWIFTTDRIVEWMWAESGSVARAQTLKGWLFILLSTLLILILGLIARKNVRKATQALRRNEKEMRTTLESIGDGVISTDLDGRVTHLNAAAESLTGWSEDDACGQPFNVVFPTMVIGGEQLVEPVTQLLASPHPTPQRGNVTLRKRDGTQRKVAETIAPIRNREGAITGVVVVFEDISTDFCLRESLRKSEERYALAVEATTDGIWEVDREHDFFYTSPRMLEILGYAPDEVEFGIDDFPHRLHPEDRDPTRRAFERIWRGESERLTIKFRLRHKNGSYRWMRCSATQANRAPSGKITRLIGATSDITEQVGNEEELDYLNELLRTVRDISLLINREHDRASLLKGVVDLLVHNRGIPSASISSVDHAGIPGHFAAAGYAEELETVRARHLSGECQRKLETYELRNGVYLDRTRMDANGTDPAYVEVWVPLHHRDIQYGFLAATVTESIFREREDIAILAEVGEDLGNALFRQDLEKQRESTVQELLEAKEAAESANRAKDEFLAIMSHEMRTPLNPIMGFTNVLLTEIEETEQREYLESILLSSQRLLHLVDDVLEYARLDRGTTRPVWSSFNPLEICKSALQSAAESCTSGLEFRFVNGFDGLPPVDPTMVIRGERLMMHRILDNLLSNASKFTQSGTISLEVARDPADNGRGVTLHFGVVDTGCGIDTDFTDRIFHPFEQSDASYSRRHEGAGLGLATCRKLVELLGGEIGVTSVPGDGARFWFRLPVEVLGTGTRGSRAPFSENHVPRLDRRCRILLAEDSDENAHVTSVILERAGGEVTVAADGREALECCRSDSFDLILMDLNMPVMDGFEAAEKLRLLPEPVKSTPIIALSAHVTDVMRASVNEVGMDDHVRKPVVAEELIETINRFI